uniref:EF-hand domain-containing protein n=1 Tax=Arion vulgaris TaxID=1028688 RepID=A0A0B6ZYS9_9EUPU
MGSEFKITDKQYSEANQTFTLFDKKGDGTISTKDLNLIFKSLGLQVDGQKLKDWADDADEEACGFIKWEQFKLIFEIKLKEDEDEREIKEAFRVLDKGNKGVIAVDDLRWILRSLGDDLSDDEIEDMINETDTDGSGTVDYEEFRNLMCS